MIVLWWVIAFLSHIIVDFFFGEMTEKALKDDKHVTAIFLIHLENLVMSIILIQTFFKLMI